jgi:2-keto-3-deoxy-L-rhamnonate aldolase RhmA
MRLEAKVGVREKKMMNKTSAGKLGQVLAVICLVAMLVPEAVEAQDRAPPQRVKELASEGKPTIGVICQLPSAPAITLLSQAGFDWLWLDMEHGAVNIETIQPMVQATTGTPTVPLVRLPWNHHWLTKPALDTGAMGIITPFVSTKEEAAAAGPGPRYPQRGFVAFFPLLPR